MEKIQIYKFQLENIKEALRMTSNIHNSRLGETCFDRTVRQAYQYVNNALDGKIDERVNYMKTPNETEYLDNPTCEHPYASLIDEEHGNPHCLKCGKYLND